MVAWKHSLLDERDDLMHHSECQKLLFPCGDNVRRWTGGGGASAGSHVSCQLAGPVRQLVTEGNHVSFGHT